MRENYWYITPEDYEEAEKNGISKTLLYQRVRIYNWSIERAINTKKRGSQITSEEWREGVRNGLSRHLILSRLRRGWDLERACTEKVKK